MCCINLHEGGDGITAVASIETPATRIGENINIVAYFADEKLFRSVCITVGQPTSVPGNCNGVGGGGTTTSGTTAGTTGPPPPPPPPPPPGTTTGVSSHKKIQRGTGKAQSSVASARIAYSRSGRVLIVKINSIYKTAKIQIRLVDAKGHVIGTVVRTVKTNKSVQVSNLKLSKNVRNVRVQVVG
jgi:hypothetical protein